MDPQARSARYDRRKRIHVEGDHAAKNREHEWVPLQCGEKVTVKELNSAPRHSARDAWQPGKLMKQTVRPREPKRQPDGCEAERQSRGAQPNQLMIGFAWNKPPNRKLHLLSVNGAMPSRRPSHQT